MEVAYDNDAYDDDCCDEIADRIMCGASDDSATTNGTGSTVRVYQPMPYKTSFSKHHPRMMDHQNHNRDNNNNNNNNNTLTSTFIGGSRGRTDHTGSSDGVMCAICQDQLYPLVQYYNSVRGYTLQVRACNRPSCYRTLFPSVLDDDDDDESTATSNTRNGLHYGGNGVVVARRILLHNDNTNHPETTTGVTGTVSSTTSNTITASTTSATPFEEAPRNSVVQVSSRNEWTSTMDMVEDGIERNVTTNSIKNQSCNENKDHDDHLDHMDDFDALESQLAAIEARSSTTPSSSATTSVKKKNTINKTKSTGTGNTTTSPIDGFPCYMLYGLQEPPAIQLYNKVSIQDKDDVGLSGSTTSKNDQRKIQQMLQQYMEEMEDDVDMLHLLQQQQQQQPSSSLSSSSNKYNGKSSKNPMERDERLSVMDRALFTYMDRLKRIPRQVLRHGIGTLPLWSIPIISLEQQQSQLSSNKHGKGNRKSSSSIMASSKRNQPKEIYGYEQPLPTCTVCGTRLRFELQILSSILHVLNVDNCTTDGNAINGGMDWGNIGVYTCPNPISQCRSNDAFCVVQDSIDHVHLPNMKIHANDNKTSINSTKMHPLPSSTLPVASSATHVVIPENAHFDPEDDDDGIVLVGEEYDNECDDDDESVW